LKDLTKIGKEIVKTLHHPEVPTSFADLRNIRVEKKCKTWTNEDLIGLLDVEKKRIEYED